MTRAGSSSNIIAIFDTYRWNSYAEVKRADPGVWHGLQDNDRWQSGYLKGDDLAEMAFWLGDDSATQPAAGGVRSVSSV